MPHQSAILKQQLFQSLGLPWQDMLPDSRLETILEETGTRYRQRLYTPLVTLWAMVYQVLCADKSLRNTVKWLRQGLVAVGATPPSSDTGSYSKARQRLPESLLQRLIPESAEQLEHLVPADQLWCGRRVRVFDGSTVLMSDSEANQGSYPQHGNQRPGCGFPIARIVVFFSLLTGVVVSACIAPWTTSEIVMSRELYYQMSSR